MKSRMKSPEKLYQFHTHNLQAIDQGLKTTLEAARDAIAQSRDRILPTYVRLYAFLMGAWTECRLLKLLFEPNAFSGPDRSRVLQRNALERWTEVVETAFRRHYSIPTATLGPPALPATAHTRMTLLRVVLEKDLRSVITLRNKLAHGQWVYPLNEALDDIAQEQMDALRTETILSLKQKAALVNYVCDAIHDLVVSRPTFDRDFDDHFRCIEQVRINIARKSYAGWADQIRLRYQRGVQRYRTQSGPATTL
jgi:hypothetical protein